MPQLTSSSSFPLYQRRNVSRIVKSYVWDMTHGNCWYCGGALNPFQNFVVEHIIPLCRGGSNDIENLAPACNWCNQSKGTKTPEEWRSTYADENGLDPDSVDGWAFWFERSHGSREDPPNMNAPNRFLLKHSRVEWREMEIIGFRVSEDCQAQGGC